MQEINVLSYNVSWEAMSNGIPTTGTVPGSINCGIHNCKDNVTQLINNSIINDGINLIGIQESGRLEDIIIPNFEKITWHMLGALTSYSMVMYNTTIFNNITDTYFNLNDPHDPSKKHVYGDIGIDKSLVSEHRPYQIIVLEHKLTKKNILFINLHNDHKNNAPHTFQCIVNKMNDPLIKRKDIGDMKVIITGDFNTNLPSSQTINGKIFQMLCLR